jgi:hypothetical protein
MKGEITWRKREAGIKKNREAISGKMALYSTYEVMGRQECAAAREVLHSIYRLRMALKNRIGEDD